MMKITLITAALLAGIATGAQAADGTITFNGNISNQTCTIIGNGSGPNFSVTLPKVSLQSLKTAGSTAGRTPFKIGLTNCSPDTGFVHTFFESGPTTDATTGNLNVNEGDASAKNVQLQVLNKDYSQIQMGKPDSDQNSEVVNVAQDGTATMYYYGQYTSVPGGATAGEANSSVQYTIAYQ